MRDDFASMQPRRPGTPVRRSSPTAVISTRPAAMQIGRNLTPRGSVAAKVAMSKQTPKPAQVIAEKVGEQPKSEQPLKVAIVHDWLIGGGAELVVEQLHELFPDAPIYTSCCTAEWRKRLDSKVRTGLLQCWPFPRLRKFLPPLRIWWFSHLDLRGYDLVISSSGAEAKGIRVPPSTLHINYCHAPTHYYWSRYREYLVHPGLGILDPLARFGLRLLINPMRRWDYKAAQRPDFMVANSAHIKSEIQKYYDRSAVVIHPPVYTERFTKQPPVKRQGFVISGRQTPYKRFDLAVAACTKLSLPLTVIGDGPDHRRLKKLAGKTVTFLGKVKDTVLEEEFARARALIFPGTDDFGITPVEAMAAGTPVIAYKAGGALDYVTPGTTGELFDEPTVKSLALAIRTFSKHRYDAEVIVQSAARFSRQQFRRKMRTFITKALKESQV